MCFKLRKISGPLPKQHFFVERVIKKWEDVDDHSATGTR